MKKHVCKIDDYCICDLQGLEPDELCPKHGIPERRCGQCGRFLKGYMNFKNLERDYMNIEKNLQTVRS